jgi:hypothetical protein
MKVVKYQVNENDEAQSFRTGNRACGTPRRYGNDDLADLVKSDFSIAAAYATAIEPLSARLALNKLHAQPGVADILSPVRKAASKLPSRLLAGRSDILSRAWKASVQLARTDLGGQRPWIFDMSRTASTWIERNH